MDVKWQDRMYDGPDKGFLVLSAWMPVFFFNATRNEMLTVWFCQMLIRMCAR